MKNHQAQRLRQIYQIRKTKVQMALKITTTIQINLSLVINKQEEKFRKIKRRIRKQVKRIRLSFMRCYYSVHLHHLLYVLEEDLTNDCRVLPLASGKAP